MKHPNYEDKQGKHPIPHAKGITKDETRQNNSKPEITEYPKNNEEEE